MVPIQKLAAAIKTNREEFKVVFLQAQIGLASRMPFDAVTNATDDQQAFTDALNYADANNFLQKLIDILIEDSVRNGKLLELIAAEGGAVGGNNLLHAMTNAARGFSIPDIIYGGLGEAMKWTGKVLVDNTPQGTGVLIGPNLFLTAWHVVRALFKPSATKPGEWDPIPGSGKKIIVEFEDLLSLLGRRTQVIETQKIQGHKDWYVAHSPCRAEELQDDLPKDLQDLNNHWDYAVIRLEKAPGVERRYAKLEDNSVVPVTKDKIILFQHPAGQPLRFDDDEIAPFKPLNPKAISRFRFLHYVNGVKGSSGGPCFDKSFVFFGLHQGQWITKGPDGKTRNRGIPIARIYEHIKTKFGDLPPPDPSEIPIWRIKGAQVMTPVLGLRTFQEKVWQAVAGSTLKIIIVKGKKGKGKTFCGELLQSMLPDALHLKIKLDAQVISKDSAETLAEKIAGLAGTTVKDIDRSTFSDSTPAVWLKGELIAKLLSKIDEVRQGRLVWISISELNKFDIEGPHSSLLLHLLYEESLTVPWLRFFLDGMRGDMPGRLEISTAIIPLRDLTKDDIESFLLYARGELRLQISDATIKVDTAEAFEDYQDLLDEDPPDVEAEKKLAKRMGNKLKRYWELEK